MSKEIVSWKQGAPYATAIKANGFLFVSGNVGVDPATGTLAEGGTGAQTAQVLKNLQAIIKSAGASLDDVVRATVYLTDMADFSAMNEVYRTFFSNDPPTRTTVGTSGLARAEFTVEIDVIAVLP